MRQPRVVRSGGGASRAIALNAAAHFGSYGLNSLLALIVGIIVIRHLGRSEYGVMAFVVAYASFFQILTSVGADTVIVREIARQPDQASKIVGGALSLRVVLSAATMVLSWSIIPFLGVDWRTTILVMLYSTTFLFSFSGLYVVLFNVELRSYVPNLVLGVWSTVYAVIRLGMVVLGAQLEHFLVIEVLSAVAGFLLCRWVSIRWSSLRPHFHVDVSLWRLLLTNGWPIAVANWLIALHWRIDQVMLFRFGGAAELGGYAVAVRMSETWSLVANALIVSVFPLLSRRGVEGPQGVDRMLSLAYPYLYMVIFPIVLGLSVYSSFLLALLFGPSFVGAAMALTLLAIAEIAVFSNSVTYNALFSMDYQREAALIASASLILNVFGNFWLIPRAGGAGAAAASLLSYAAVPILALLLPRVRWIGTKALCSLARPSMALALTGGALWLASPAPPVGFMLIAVAYPVALVMVGGLNRTDLELLRGVLSSRAVPADHDSSRVSLKVD